MASRRCKAGITAGLIGGLFVSAGLIAGIWWLMERHRASRRRYHLPRLTAAIVGNTKAAVASVFGPPRVATFMGETSTDYRDAAVWYYPLPREERIGLAIRFDDNRRAANVEIIRGPQ